MIASLEVLAAEVLKLPPSDQSHLLERLVASLDEDQEMDAAWDAVADVREGELAAGAAVPVALDGAIARLEARFPG